MFLKFKDLSHLFQKHVRFSSGSFQTGVLGQALQYKVLLAGALCKLCSKLKQDWQGGIFWRLCSTKVALGSVESSQLLSESFQNRLLQIGTCFVQPFTMLVL